MSQRANALEAAPLELPRLPEITQAEFALLQELILRESGICLGPGKQALMVGRLGVRLRALGLESFRAYYRYVLDDDGEERARMLDCISTNETSFFREPRQFKFLEEQVFPVWRAEAEAGRSPRCIRAWSAGCSTGEEPYSLAMLLRSSFAPEEGWQIEIRATDLSRLVLKRARTAVWPLDRASEIPKRYVKRFMLKGTGSQADKMKAGSEIRSLVRFSELNLSKDDYDIQGPFDLILCRNVLIYFAAESRVWVIGRLLDLLTHDGLLLLGHSESLIGLTERVEPLVPTVYRLVDGAVPGGAKAGRGALKGAPWRPGDRNGD
jgi:chemotaxis protein methyltransferase CheR